MMMIMMMTFVHQHLHRSQQIYLFDYKRNGQSIRSWGTEYSALEFFTKWDVILVVCLFLFPSFFSNLFFIGLLSPTPASNLMPKTSSAIVLSARATKAHTEVAPSAKAAPSVETTPSPKATSSS